MQKNFKMKIKGKKILVTGGAGFIGSHICERLVKMGAEVTVFDNFCTGKIRNLSNIRKDIALIRGDIRNFKQILKATKAQDIIVHEAFPYGLLSPAIENQFVDSSAIGTFNVLRAALEKGAKKVVYASSVAVYGQQKHLPINEEYPKKPFYPYGAIKYAAELLCSSFNLAYNLETVSLRYFNVYGLRYAQFDHSAIIAFLNNVIKNKPPIIYGTGKQLRDFTFISDVVDGTILAIKKGGKGEVFNIGFGQGTKILDLAEKIIKISGKNLKPVFAKSEDYRYFNKTVPYGVTKKIKGGYIDTRSYIGDITKAKRFLRYNPKINLNKGIKQTYTWLTKESKKY